MSLKVICLVALLAFWLSLRGNANIITAPASHTSSSQPASSDNSSLQLFYSYAPIILSLFIVRYIYNWSRNFHVECSKYGCDKCEDVLANPYHCGWCVNYKCGGRTIDECNCECHVHKYIKGASASNDPAYLTQGGGGHSHMYGSNGMKKVDSGCNCGAPCEDVSPFIYFKNAYLRSVPTRDQSNTHRGAPLYDVVYMGAGLVNLMSAYYILMHSSNHVRMAMIDPRSSMRDDPTKDYKVGESTLIPASSMLFMELGLHDWMIENCPPKMTLTWHWPKFPRRDDGSCGRHDSMVDWYTLEETVPTVIPTYQLNRAKLEAHLIALCQNRGATYIRGFAKVEQLGEGGAYHAVRYTPVDEGEKVAKNEASYHPEIDAAQEARKSITIWARHLVDGAGFKFLISSKKNLTLKTPEDIHGIDNASIWIRIKHPNYEQNTLHGDSGYLAGRPNWVSMFYNTNHFMGVGHWIWTIPIAHSEAREISIGVTIHKQYHRLSDFNTPEKLMAFLKANNGVVYKIAASGELVDFQYLPRLAHYTKQPISMDNWYIQGEAAYMGDPHFSTGLVNASHHIIQNAGLILGRLGGVDELLMRKYFDAYCNFQYELPKTMLHLIRHHPRHMGNASIMAWRLFMEVTWQSVALAIWDGKWYLCPAFCAASNTALPRQRWVQKGFHDLLDQLADERKSIGMVDMALPGCINILSGRGSWLYRAAPLRLWHFDDMISNGLIEFKHANFFQSNSWAHYYFICQLFVIVKRGWGWSGFISQAKIVWPRIIYCLLTSIIMYILGIKHFARVDKRKQPHNRWRSLRFHQMNNTYHPPKELNPWI